MRRDSDLKSVVARLAELYDSKETRAWLHAKHPLLGGETAIDLIHHGRAEEVLTVIESFDEGSYS